MSFGNLIHLQSYGVSVLATDFVVGGSTRNLLSVDSEATHPLGTHESLKFRSATVGRKPHMLAGTPKKKSKDNRPLCICLVKQQNLEVSAK